MLTNYATKEMNTIWSDQNKYKIWRQLWIALAEAQQILGLNISNEQIRELQSNATNIDYQKAADYEKRLRHDVMAHVHTYREQCPLAGGIIHLGATSCYITDNSELIQMRDSMQLILTKLHHPNFAEDANELTHRLQTLKFRGAKGATGTQATFLQLFKGDHNKVEQLDTIITQKMGFAASYPITGQTYTRKIDAFILATLADIGHTCQRTGKNAIGHQLANFAIKLAANGPLTSSLQWMERTLDDSANRRLVLSQAFLAIDAALHLLTNINATKYHSQQTHE